MTSVWWESSLRKDPPRHKQFENKICICKSRSRARPPVTDEMVLQAFQRAEIENLHSPEAVTLLCLEFCSSAGVKTERQKQAIRVLRVSGAAGRGRRGSGVLVQ